MFQDAVDTSADSFGLIWQHIPGCMCVSTAEMWGCGCVGTHLVLCDDHAEGLDVEDDGVLTNEYG